MMKKNVGMTSTNRDLKGFIDQNQSPTKGNISIITLPINVNVGPQMIINTSQRLTNSGSRHIE
uniref:Uncharacterized protein n=1 Tax=Accipiter nisus TaxID=211598 RepID=A0A8B9MWW6_9AVES